MGVSRMAHNSIMYFTSELYHRREGVCVKSETE